ncbi:MAG: glycosyltransferase family 4 protein [FCB group bacterium]|nr:glycosyltransferase family 4 protein [FCB group bacterium]
MENKRIVIFGWAGSVHVRRWAKGLAERGYDIKVISLGFEPIEGIETVVFPRKGKWSYYRYAAQAVREAKKFQPHLIHIHYAGGFGLWGLKAKFHPTLVSVWGADVIDLPHRFFYGYFIRKILKKSTYISATSKMLKKATIKILPSAKNKIEVIPFGVKLPSSLVKLPPSNKIKICYIKALRKKYGPDILLRAMAKVVREFPNIELNIAGEGELREKLETMIINLNLEKKVNLLGFIRNEEIYSFIKQHHFMVMPSIMESESFGVAALEAQASGRAVIASNVGGIPEVLVDGKTGILLPKGDVDRLAQAILKLANDYDLMQKMGNAGYEFVKENYSWDKSLDMMTTLYEKLINEKS